MLGFSSSFHTELNSRLLSTLLLTPWEMCDTEKLVEVTYHKMAGQLLLYYNYYILHPYIWGLLCAKVKYYIIYNIFNTL